MPPAASRRGWMIWYSLWVQCGSLQGIPRGAASCLVALRASDQDVGCELRQQPDGPDWSARSGLRSVPDDSRGHATMVGDQPIIDSITAVVVIEYGAVLAFHPDHELVGELVLRAQGREAE